MAEQRIGRKHGLPKLNDTQEQIEILISSTRMAIMGARNEWLAGHQGASIREVLDALGRLTDALEKAVKGYPVEVLDAQQERTDARCYHGYMKYQCPRGCTI